MKVDELFEKVNLLASPWYEYDIVVDVSSISDSCGIGPDEAIPLSVIWDHENRRLVLKVAASL